LKGEDRRWGVNVLLHPNPLSPGERGLIIIGV
jgi:hypothetical protein